MEHILDHVGIYVNENGKRYPYKRIFDNNGVPNYYPPAAKNAIYKDFYIDEILFLPIELETFNTDRKHKFFGFRYLFNSSGHSTLSLGPDPMELGVTFIQITFEVHRVRFYLKDQLDLVIDKVYDPLYPPRIFNIHSRSADLGMTLQKLVQDNLASFNEFYMDSRV